MSVVKRSRAPPTCSVCKQQGHNRSTCQSDEAKKLRVKKAKRNEGEFGPFECIDINVRLMILGFLGAFDSVKLGLVLDGFIPLITSLWCRRFGGPCSKAETSEMRWLGCTCATKTVQKTFQLFIKQLRSGLRCLECGKGKSESGSISSKKISKNPSGYIRSKFPDHPKSRGLERFPYIWRTFRLHDVCQPNNFVLLSKLIDRKYPKYIREKSSGFTRSKQMTPMNAFEFIANPISKYQSTFVTHIEFMFANETSTIRYQGCEVGYKSCTGQIYLDTKFFYDIIVPCLLETEIHLQKFIDSIQICDD